MAKRRRHTPDQIIRKLAEGNKLLTRGIPVRGSACGAQLIRVGPARKDAVTVVVACSGADPIDGPTARIEEAFAGASKCPSTVQDIDPQAGCGEALIELPASLRCHEATTDVPGYGITVSHAQAQWLEFIEQAFRCQPCRIGVDVEYPHDWALIPPGRNCIASNQRTLRRNPHGQVARGVARRRDQLSPDLPIQWIPWTEFLVKRNRGRCLNEGHDLLEQWAFPLRELRLATRAAPSEDVRLLGRSK